MAKLVLGYLTGAVSVISDGLHSITDSFSNVAGLIGVRVARKPPDEDHPYGHRKFETMGAALIGAFLMVVMIELGRATWQRLSARGAGPETPPLSFVVMRRHDRDEHARHDVRAPCGNQTAERGAPGRRDAYPQRRVRVVHGHRGADRQPPWLPLLDPLAAIVVVGFIGHAAWEIFRGASDVLADRIVIAEDEVRSVVMTVPAVMGCHEIRTRGPADYVFLDLHMWMASKTPLDQAHAISHQVKDRLMARFPQIRDAVIHIEPPPSGETRGPEVRHGDRRHGDAESAEKGATENTENTEAIISSPPDLTIAD